MKIHLKQYILDIPETITVEYVEDFIAKSGFKPLRWAIVKAENKKLLIDAVVL